MTDGDMPFIHHGASVGFFSGCDDIHFCRISVFFIIQHIEIASIHIVVDGVALFQRKGQDIIGSAILIIFQKIGMLSLLPCIEAVFIVCHSFTDGLVDGHGIDGQHCIKIIGAGIGDHDAVNVSGTATQSNVKIGGILFCSYLPRNGRRGIQILCSQTDTVGVIFL